MDRSMQGGAAARRRALAKGLTCSRGRWPGNLSSAGRRRAALSAEPIGDRGGGVLAVAVVVLSQTFPARPSSFPETRDFVMRALADSPISDEARHEIQMAVADALLEAAGPGDDMIQASLRIFPDSVEVDVLR